MSLVLLLTGTPGAPPGAPSVPTGAARFPGTDVYPDPDLYPSQGVGAYVRARISTDDVSVASPTWTEVDSSKMRSFSISRGRGSEMDEFATGNGNVTFDNRDRAFDPNSNPLIRPLNRIWIYEEFAGEVRDLIKGYVESWDLGYPGGLADATATANFSDEMLVLSLMALPTTDPVRESYSDLVASDNPVGYWNLNEDPANIAAFEPTPPPPAEEVGADEESIAQIKRAGLRKAFPATHRKRFG